MIQQKNRRKKCKYPLLPSNDPITMEDKYKSFYDQYLYEIDFDKNSEKHENDKRKMSVCAIWPRPRFMLQITPSMGNRQSFYQNNFNMIQSAKNSNAAASMIYQKKKYHTKKESLNEDFKINNVIIQNTVQQTYLQASNQNFEEQNSNITVSRVQPNDQSFPIPHIQINPPKLTQNSSDSLDNQYQDHDQMKEDQNHFQEQENQNNSISDQTQAISANKTQPQIMQMNSQQQLLTKKMKANIIQHPFNVTGIQFALQHQEMMKVNSLQKLQQIQQIQRLQSKNQNLKSISKNPNETEETEENTKIENQNENENDADKYSQPVSNEPQKKKNKPRQNFTPQQKMLLERFIYDHIDHPYAENKDLIMLEKQTNLSKKQIRVYMTNARMRKFAGNKIPVLKKSGNIVMRKGVPLQNPIARLDQNGQPYIPCYSKKINVQAQVPRKMLMNQSESFPNNNENTDLPKNES